MDNLLDIYTRIKLRIGSEIIVSYYRYGVKITRSMKLENIYEFKYLICSSDFSELTYINFFGKDIVIESIYVSYDSNPLYYNPYINKEKFKGLFIDEDYLLRMKRMILGERYTGFDNDSTFYKKFVAKDDMLDFYVAKYENVSVDELFFSDKQKEEFNYLFNFVVSELDRHAKRNGFNSELKFITSGKTSLIYEIGDKIIKIGKSRRYDYIPYCEYILQPIVNRDFSFDGYPIHIEITQKVLVLKDKDGNFAFSKYKCNRLITKLRKNLESIGIMARDLHMENVGILLDDNRIHYDQIDFNVGEDLVTSIENNNDFKILKRGKLVILDLDCLRIEDVDKYMKYLEHIGLEQDKISNVAYRSKCLVRK